MTPAPVALPPARNHDLNALPGRLVGFSSHYYNTQGKPLHHTGWMRVTGVRGFLVSGQCLHTGARRVVARDYVHTVMPADWGRVAPGTAQG